MNKRKGYRGFASKEAYEEYYSDVRIYAHELPAMEQYTKEGLVPDEVPHAVLEIHEALNNLERLRDAAIDSGETKLSAYLRAACKCCELALMMEAQARNR